MMDYDKIGRLLILSLVSGRNDCLEMEYVRGKFQIFYPEKGYQESLESEIRKILHRPEIETFDGFIEDAKKGLSEE